MFDYRTNTIDFKWSHIGDFIVKGGDLDDTSDTAGGAFLQEIETRVSSALNDWKTVPRLGSTIDEYIGQVNNQETANNIQNALIQALVWDGYLDQSDFQIVILPVSKSEILIRIKFLGLLTASISNSTMMLNIVFDLEGHGPYLVR